MTSIHPEHCISNLTPENAASYSENFIRSIPDFNGVYRGKGIVIPAGGLNYFSNAWVCIKMLRHLGCNLPIEIWHFGESEIDSTLRSVVSALGVECIDALRCEPAGSAQKLRGYGLKPYALLNSKFKEILLLDADNVPVVNPEFLFESVEYIETGAIFWPDFGRFESTHPIWAICGVEYRDEPEFESGQIVINKEKCWKALNLCLWYNYHPDFYYHHILGDKDTFRMAFRKLAQPYSMPAKGIFVLESTMCQHDFEGNRIFQHRNFAKWNLFSNNNRIEGFLFEDQCLKYLAELRDLLAEHWHWRRFNFSKKNESLRRIAREIIGKTFIYRRVGYDHRLMTFLSDGIVGIGNAGNEIFWDLKEICSEIVMEIASDQNLTCELKRGTDLVWRGRWLHHEKMPIELRLNE